MLNKPGWGENPNFVSDPQIRMQEWGANLRRVTSGHPIDINSDLLGISRPLSKDCVQNKYPNRGIARSKRVNYAETNTAFVQESRATHPAWMYKDLEQNHKYYLPLDPQENAIINFQNNLNTRLLERDNHKTNISCPIEQNGTPIGVFERNKELRATLKKYH
tara:strand:+ start:147 stop:632 length:486 start_codon:yes stop_codon:yes gene_type:complete